MNDQASSFRWATVTGLSPLRIRLDGESSALNVTPDTLVAPASLAVGNRVWVQLYARRVIVHGRSGG